MQTQHIIQHFSHLVLGLCICTGISYIFMRGFLGVTYELANWAVTKLNGPDNERDPNPPR
jgi:hypothetical protein